MNEILKVFVINLERSNRWPAQRDMLETMGIEAERWLAVDGRKKPLAELVQEWSQDGVLSPEAGFLNEDRTDGYKQGVIGLLASSAMLWRHITTIDQEWSLILEDDCALHPVLADSAWVKFMWSQLPADAEFVYFGLQMLHWMVREAMHRTGSKAPITDHCVDWNSMFVRITKPLYGSYAYAIKRSTAQKLLGQLPFKTPVDHVFYPNRFSIYAIKEPCDWWGAIEHADNSHLFWGVAAPRAVASTIKL